jgi:fibronectin-binding autotransporter adhesin
VPGTGPTVQFWDYDGQEFEPDNFGSVTPDIGPNFTGGLFVAGGFFTNNRDEDGFVYADLVVSADAGGNAHQTIYRLDEFTSPDQRSGATYIIAGSPPGINVNTNLPEDVTPNTGLQSDVNVYGTSTLPFHGGVRVGVISNPDPNGFDNLVTGAGPGGGPHVKIFSGLDGTMGATTVVNQFMAFDINFTGGVSIG